MRQAIQISVRGIKLAGTCHIPEPASAGAHPGNAVGVMLLNPGYLPRAARGDLGVYLSDFLAERGFPAFRFDMPALGDSEGVLPAEVLEFFEHVQTGGHEPFLSGLRDALIERYQLKGMIYLGHCGGATTAVYSADRCNGDDLLGLILLDPAFVWYRPPPKPKPDAKGIAKAMAVFRTRIWQAYQSARTSLLPTPPGQVISKGLAAAKRVRQRLRGEPLPSDANVRLIRCWERLAHSGKPLLVLTAEPPKKKANYFDYLGYLEQRHPGRLSRYNIEGTSHSFVEGNGTEEVMTRIDAWLAQRFPGVHRSRSAGSHSEASTALK